MFTLIQAKNTLVSYLTAIAIVVLCTLINFVIHIYLNDNNAIMIYMLGVTIVALLYQRAASIVASLLSILSYDYFFVFPYYSFSVAELDSLITLIVMLVVTQAISYLSLYVRRQMETMKKIQAEKETERLRNILLTSISHDLRTPLTVIMGSAGSLLAVQDIDAGTRRELLQGIHDESERLNNIVNNILQIVRLESGSIQVSCQHNSLEETINIIIEKLKTRLNKKNVSINFPAIPVYLRFDQLLIGQVLVNLIENAIKFASDNTAIEISLEYEPTQALVKIADRGVGLDLMNAEKIFDKFYRGYHPETPGAGLGLAICKSIIVAHGGKIWASSRVDGGAKFYFTLPIGN